MRACVRACVRRAGGRAGGREITAYQDMVHFICVKNEVELTHIFKNLQTRARARTRATGGQKGTVVREKKKQRKKGTDVTKSAHMCREYMMAARARHVERQSSHKSSAVTREEPLSGGFVI